MDNIKVLPIKDRGKRPIWSVMIPSYNRDEFLKQALISVLQQDQGPEKMEIWVVDDCSSTGDPEKLIKKIGEGRVKFFKQKKNVGQLKNFETCLNLARGKLIHLLHSDDFVHPEFYSRLEGPMTQNENIGAAFTRHNTVDEQNKVLTTSEEISPTPGILADFIKIIASNQIIQTPSIVVKRLVYEKLGGFNKNMKGAEDWEMWVRISCNFKFYYEPGILASYRIHWESNTGDSYRTGRFIDDALHCIKVYSTYLPVEEKELKVIDLKAKKGILEYAFSVSRKFKNELNDRKTALNILYKSYTLTYNLLSLFTVSKEILKIRIKGVWSSDFFVRNLTKNYVD